MDVDREFPILYRITGEMNIYELQHFLKQQTLANRKSFYQSYRNSFLSAER